MSDKKYVIKDYSNHYYKLDQESNQLVVAKGKLEATQFTAAQIKARIGSSMKSHFYMTEIIDMATNDSQKVNLFFKSECKDNEKVETNMDIRDIDITNIDWELFFDFCIRLINQADDESEELQREYAKHEREMLDLLHYVEMYDLNDENMSEAVRSIKESRIKRRIVKDKLYHLGVFQQVFSSKATIERLHEAAEWTKTREYRPRELKGLFKSIDVPRTNIDEYLNRTRECEEIIEVNGDYDMNYEKKVTAFDNKKINWLEFAEEQLCFYENAEQYYINLQMEVAEIDEMIADVLKKLENGTYNCVQGYRVFKELKDLRVERKEKERNLKCLKLLTGYVDSEAMADNLRYAVNQMLDMDYIAEKTNEMITDSSDKVVAV